MNDLVRFALVAFFPRVDDLPGLAELWRRPDSDLKALTRGTPMTRAKLTGLRRNLAVAIANSHDPDAHAALESSASSAAAGADDGRPSLSDPLVAEHVAWARQEIKRRL